LRDLVGTFLAEEPGNVELVVAAAARGDSSAAVRPAHTLKSSSAVIGAARLSSTSRQIELAGRDGRTADLAALAEGLQAAWTATVEALRAKGLAQ
jgi:HPt (histidine-containing phosphotransfer) domain-containing protein